MLALLTAALLFITVVGAFFLIVVIGAFADRQAPRIGARPARYGRHPVVVPSSSVTLGMLGITLLGCFVAMPFVETMSHDDPVFLLVVLLTIADVIAYVYCTQAGYADVRDDGVDFRHPVFGARFVAYAAMVGTRPHDDERFELRWLDRRGRERTRTLRAPARVRARIDEARLSASQTNDLAETAHTLSPTELGQASLGVATQYRIAAPTREELWRVVEAGDLRPESRVLAARAIAATFVQDEATRLRVLASQTPDEDLRTALEDLARAPLARTTPKP